MGACSFAGRALLDITAVKKPVFAAITSRRLGQ
jgi:hypothetical protein